MSKSEDISHTLESLPQVNIEGNVNSAGLWGCVVS